MAVQTVTRKADKIAVGKYLFDTICENECLSNAERLLQAFHDVEKELNAIYGGSFGAFPKIENKPFYLFTNNFYIVDPSRYLCPNTGGVPTSVDGVTTTYIHYDWFEKIFANNKNCPIFSGYNNGYRQITNKDGKNYINIAGWHPNYYSSYYRNFYIYDNGNSCGYNTSDYNSISDLNADILRLPVTNIAINVYSSVSFNLMPSDLTETAKILFATMVDYNKKGFIEWDGNSIKGFTQAFYTALKNNEIADVEEIALKKETVKKYIEDGNAVHLQGKAYDDFVKMFVNVDNVRINLTPYEENRLTDPNGGHWDLWVNEAKEGETLINLDTSFYGRNPVADVQLDGIVGIDFGTKSTVVTFQNGTDTTRPMRIGNGDFASEITPKDYENPTVMEFINLEKFLERYNASESRPETEWIDMTISHTAYETMNNLETGSQYYAWFSDLKQWASDKNRKIIIRDKQGMEVELSPFVDISSGELNPIELYAYLLGLFINNMYNGIYVNYILSFPVTYERKIRLKIAQCFEDGLKKSLPAPVKESNKIMEVFRVMEGASEPAAYAVCALQEYGFKPADGEKFLYGIFDFGGGTTDFDFGIWEKSPKKLQRRYDYVIKHFGAGGDRLLGGENILEMLAYHVFKSNKAVLRENGVQFVKPADCDLFDGSEILINNSQQAKINLRQLAEKLRPLWEGGDFNKESIQLNLFTSNNEVVTPELKVNTGELLGIIRKRIDKGVENFFEAMKKAVTDEIAEGTDKIYIFLAGNSSKSKIVLESFGAYKEKYRAVFVEKLNVEIKVEEPKKVEESKEFDENALREEWEKLIELISSSQLDNKYHNGFKEECLSFLSGNLKKILEDYGTSNLSTALSDYVNDEFTGEDASSDYALDDFLEENGFSIDEYIEENTDIEFFNNDDIFVIYPPLGTPEADSILEKKGIEVSDSVMRPTGKTGVAYGLLSCRPGSRVKVESEIKETDEIKFNFYTGFNNSGKFEVITDRDIEYGKWIEFIDASESDFELYYTNLPECADNQMSINGVRKKVCRIDETMEDAMVYIRAVEPSVIEYCASYGEDDLKKEAYLSPPKKLVLE